ncbi:AraC family transcriptional regulator [Clostridiales bacterium COT073_COT-073]|nr:AraC family transcriptional regulator [Clostridiales bacterium COT073_COT-073]
MLGFEEIVKYNLLYVDKYIFGKSWFYSENKVPYSMLRYIINGRGLFKINGEEIHLKVGDIVYISEGSLIECSSESEDFTFISIRFKSSVFFEGADFLTTYYGMDRLIESDDELQEYFVNIYKASKINSATRMLKMHGYLEILVAKLIEKSTSKNNVNDYNKIRSNLSTKDIQKKIINDNLNEDYRISMVIDYILTHSEKKYNSKDLSKMSGLCETSFRKLFKKQTGKSPNEWIRDLRIMTAARLLLSTDDNINEIAYKVGFDDVNYFIRVFKKKLGNTPKKFREIAAKYSI